MRIIWSQDARADQHRIWMFAAQHSIERADRIETRLEERVESLAGLPFQGRPAADGRRQLSIPDSQLVVRYRVAEDEDSIRVLEVWHTRENRS